MRAFAAGLLFALLFRVVLPAQQDSVRALLDLARRQSAEQRLTESLETLRRARALAPNSEEVLSGYARAALGTRAIGAAIDALEPLTRLCPTSADYHYLLGVAYLQAGDPVSAVDPLRAAEALEPNRPLTLIALGVALNNRKLYGDAKAVVRRSLDLQPDSPEALAALAEAEEGLDELDLAESHARRALAGSIGNATAHLVLGMVLTKRGQHTDARDSLLAAVAAEPMLQKAHYQLSLVYARLGDEERSRHHLALYREAMQKTRQALDTMRRP